MRDRSAGERGEDGLANPPDGVRDELDALIGVELPRRRQEADVSLADEVGEGQAAVLVLLGDRDHEAEVPLHQLLHGLRVAGAHQPGDGDLLLRRQERGLADLEQVLVQDVAVGVVDPERLRRLSAALAALPGRLVVLEDLLHRGELELLLRGVGGGGALRGLPLCRSGLPLARRL